MKSLQIIIGLCLTWSLQAQMTQSAEQGNFLLKNATIHSVTNGVFKGDLLIEGSVIKEIGAGLQSEDATVIDCTKKHIYPGMIDSGTRLGLAEISAVSLTQDHDEKGIYTPHMEALTAVNPSSVNIPVNRVNGITTVLAVPSGDLFPGKAALIHLHGYTPQQMYAGFKSVVCNFPATGKRGRWDRRSEEDIKKDSDKAMKRLNEFWESAVLHAKMDSAAQKSNQVLDYNPQLDALKDVVLNEQPIIIRVNSKADILSAIEFVNKNKINAIFSGVVDGWRVADSLAKYEIPVIAGPILKNPSRASDKYDRPYANPGLLLKAGVEVAIKTEETENVRNLPYNAGFAANYGMGKDAALEAVTIVPARLFGLDDQIGSLEEGKLANLFISDGDPFETKTTIHHLFIKGWKIPMESRHTLLYEEYLERSPGLESNR